jgi:hypothetical protein
MDELFDLKDERSCGRSWSNTPTEKSMSWGKAVERNGMISGR